MNKFLFSFFTLLFVSLTSAQQKDEVLFHIDDKPVYVSEFLSVYKKNKDVVIDENKKDIDQYLNLFINYKLKLDYAYSRHLDKDPELKKELKTYRDQLVIPYLTLPETTDKLTREAYYRTRNQVNVSHILIRVSPDAKPEDTLKAYKKISSIREKILSGKPFAEMAKQYSEDPSAFKNGGNLGYFGAFQMVYPFENAAYRTKPGTVSKPFRTQFGYHIVKVNAVRTSPGEREIAHIFIKNKPDDSLYAKTQINAIYRQLKQGEDFGYLAENHSDDTYSAAKGGKMPVIQPGKLIQPFDSIAFSIQKEGEYTKPFRSGSGWHIFKLIKIYPVPDYKTLKGQLEARIKNGSRAEIIERKLADSISGMLNISVNEPVVRSVLAQEQTASDAVLFQIKNQKYTLNDFLRYKRKHPAVNNRETFNNFKAEAIVNYYKAHLEDYNPEFARTIKEYLDGLLLFKVLQERVWKPAENDSIGLVNFFEKNRTKYQWNERAKVILATCTQKEKVDKVRELLLRGEQPESIAKQLNKGARIHVLFKEAILEKGDKRLPELFSFTKGVTPVIKKDDHHFLIVKVLETYPVQLKELDEVRGQVMNDYQNDLENRWVEELRKAHTVKINKKALKKLKKQLAKDEI